MPAVIGNVQNDARRATESAGLTGGSRIQYPRGVFLINTESVTVAVNNRTSEGILFSQQRVTRHDWVLFVSVDYSDFPAGYLEGDVLLQFL
jgi:hypothetical protein